MTTTQNEKTSPVSKEGLNPSHNKEGKYVALMETNGKECESWYYFIKYEGNEKNLKHLFDQLESVDWYVLDDLSVFDLDLDHFISAQTAKEMTTLELNSYAFHRKFDGILDRVELGFRRKDKTEKKICKAFDLLSYGQIEDYIDDEDIDDKDLKDSEEDSEEDLTDNESDSSEESSLPESERLPKGIPPSLLNNRQSSGTRKERKK